MVAASIDEAAAPPPSLDGLDDDQVQMSRIAIFELRKGFELETQETRIEKLGDWCIEGGAEGIGIYPNVDGVLGFSQLFLDDD